MHMQINISVQRNGEMVTMQIGETLPSNCLWSVSILPYLRIPIFSMLLLHTILYPSAYCILHYRKLSIARDIIVPMQEYWQQVGEAIKDNLIVCYISAFKFH